MTKNEAASVAQGLTNEQRKQAFDVWHAAERKRRPFGVNIEEQRGFCSGFAAACALYDRLAQAAPPAAPAPGTLQLMDAVRQARSALMQLVGACNARGFDLIDNSSPQKFWYELRDIGNAAVDSIDAALLAAPAAEASAPIDMILNCPACGMQHIDKADPYPELRDIRVPPWTNPPHRSHLCHGCGFIWRPADVPTNGVESIKTKGKNDSVSPAPAAPATGESGAEKLDRLERVLAGYEDMPATPPAAEAASAQQDEREALVWVFVNGRGEVQTWCQPYFVDPRGGGLDSLRTDLDKHEPENAPHAWVPLYRAAQQVQAGGEDKRYRIGAAWKRGGSAGYTRTSLPENARDGQYQLWAELIQPFTAMSREQPPTAGNDNS